MWSSISNDGTINQSPNSTMTAVIKSKKRSFSLKNQGSINVTKSGNVEKVNRPIATVET